MNVLARAIVVSTLAVGIVAGPALAQFDLGGGAEPKLVHFHLDGPIRESPGTPSPLDLIFNLKKPLSFKDLLGRFKKARDDDQVKGVILTMDSASLGMAQIEELRGAINQVRSVDKEVYVYTEEMGTGLYLLFSSASRITMVPTGTLWLTGFYAETPYIKGLLDKLEIEIDLLQYEDYKAAGEMFSRTGPSNYAKENMNWLLDGLFESFVEMIADARDMSADKVRRLIDNGPYSSEQALKAGLIDAVLHRQDFFADLRERYNDPEIDRHYGEDDGPDIPDNFFGLVKFVMNAMKGAVQPSTEPSVAIIYVEGTISSGKGDSPGGSGAYSTPIRKALNKAAKDDSVKAVVLRVDSPGGSALASEIILDATKRVAAKKPLIVSMGNVAGSGGYYVACGSHAIFADPTTITASIGVLGGKLITTGMWNKVGITWYEYRRGQNAGINSTASRYDDNERAKITEYMEEVYELFKGHVVACRGDKLTKPIGEIAGGRVFTGTQALELGLIDKLGGLDDAIKYAAAQAKVGQYEIRVIPRPKDSLEMLMDMFNPGADDDEEDVTLADPRPRLFAPDSPLLKAVLPMLGQLDPLRLKAMLRTLQRLELLQTESVLTIMPQEILIR